MDVIEKIKRLASDKKLTGVEIGKVLGLSKSPLTDWKNGKAKPTLEQIIILSDYFGVTTDYLLKGEEPKNENAPEATEKPTKVDDHINDNHFGGNFLKVVDNMLSLAKQKGMNEQDLCKLLGISKSGIYHWKNGAGEPSATQLLILSQHFNVSLDYLMGLTDNSAPQKKEFTEQDRLNKEIADLTPEKRKKAESFVRFLKTEEEFSQEFTEVLSTSAMKPQPD